MTDRTFAKFISFFFFCFSLHAHSLNYSKCCAHRHRRALPNDRRFDFGMQRNRSERADYLPTRFYGTII